MWFKEIDLEKVNKFNKNTLVEHVDIVVTEAGDDFLIGEMPVNSQVHQPFGLLHGGASCVLAETLGSIAANLTLDNSKQYAVGQSITANHIRSARDGKVIGKAKAIHLGRTSQVWEIKITTEEGKLVCNSSLTMAVLNR